MSDKREQIVEVARSWVDTKFRHQGRTADGIDCAGLIVQVGIGVQLLDPSCDVLNYGRREHGVEFLKHLRASFDISRVADLQIASVAVFRIPRFPCHVGIISKKHGHLHVIHGSLLHRRVVEEPYANEWPETITHCFEFRGVDHG